MSTDKAPIYINNSATSFPKPDQVTKALLESMVSLPEMTGRGEETATAKDRVQLARKNFARFFGCPVPERFIFTSNSSSALNQAIHGYVDHHYSDKPLEIITTNNDHNSVLRPLRTLQKEKKVNLRIIDMHQDGRFDAEAIFRAVSPETRMIAVNHLSNVIGTIAPLKDIGDFCRQNNVVFLVDASQSAGLLPIDVKEMNVDLMAITGHKYMFAPTGIGALYIGEDITLDPRKQGGTGVQSEAPFQPEVWPTRFETGTVNYHGIVAMDAAREFIENKGLEVILRHCQTLRQRCEEELRSISKVHVLGPGEVEERGAVVSFLIEGYGVAEVDMILRSHYRIIIRSGLHCAPLCHQRLGTFPEGTLRASFSCFNTLADVESLIEAVREIANN